MNDTNNTNSCTICLEEMNDDKTSYLPCCHGFHQQCFHEYITNKIKSKRNISCPVCRIEHFIYGQRNYEFIMNELGISHDKENTSYEQYIPSGLYNTNMNRTHNTNPNTNNNIYQHSVITMPMQVSPRASHRRRQQTQTNCNIFWLKYRYYIIALLLIVIISSVSFLFIFQ